MRTMQPSVTLGSYTWAQDRLPIDEFTLRLEDLHAAMDRNGWEAILAYGDVREHASLAFLSNFIPRVRWAMALLPRSGDARLVMRYEHARSAGHAQSDLDRRRTIRHGT